MTFKLPELPYDKSALEPTIDARTMAIHHGKHHAAYVDNLNKAIADYPDLEEYSALDLITNLDRVPEAIRTAVRNNGGGHVNHSMFWLSMGADGGGAPSGTLAEVIAEEFGSFDDFKTQFKVAAMVRFGSGWAWLSVDAESKLVVSSTANQDNPVSQGLIPLFGLDVWEHAYYLKYENRRAEYIASWWNVVSWKYVSSNFSTAKVALGARDVAEDVTKWAADTWSKIEAAFSKPSDQ